VAAVEHVSIPCNRGLLAAGDLHPLKGVGIAIDLASSSFDRSLTAGEASRLIQEMAAILTEIGLLSACIACMQIVVQTARHLRIR